MKLLYFDVETTGLTPGHHDIHQIAYIIQRPNLPELARNFRLAPFRPENSDPEALKVAGVTIEDINQYASAQTVFAQILSDFESCVDKYDKTDKLYPVAYNGHFDYQFLVQFFKDNNHKYFGSFVNHRLIDPLAILRFFEYCGALKFDSYKLSCVCAHFGIPISAHDALSDIYATKAILRKLTNMISPMAPFEFEPEEMKSDFLDNLSKQFSI